MEEPKTHSSSAGVVVTIDRLVCGNKQNIPSAHHAFTYHISIRNGTPHGITLLARKWVLTYDDGHVDVIEGEGIVGKSPFISSGETFSYESFHLIRADAHVDGSYHGVDEFGSKLTIPIPSFFLSIPEPKVD